MKELVYPDLWTYDDIHFCHCGSHDIKVKEIECSPTIELTHRIVECQSCKKNSGPGITSHDVINHWNKSLFGTFYVEDDFGDWRLLLFEENGWFYRNGRAFTKRVKSVISKKNFKSMIEDWFQHRDKFVPEGQYRLPTRFT